MGTPSPITSDYAKQLSDGSASGTVIGHDATDKIGFYGTTPIVRPASAGQAAVSTTAIAVAAGANPTKAEYDALVARFNSLLTLTDALRTALVNLGAIKGAA